MKRSLLWAVLLLAPMTLYMVGLSFGRPDPDFAPSIAQRAWSHPGAVYHPDEFAYVGIPYRMLLAREWNPHYYHNPSLNLYTNLGLFWLGGAEDYPHDLTYGDQEIAPFQLYVLARGLSALFTLLTVALTYAAGRVAFNKSAGLIAAGLTALSPLITEHAHFATPNAQTTMLATAALLTALIILKHRAMSQQRMWSVYAAAGLLVGLTMAARYNAAVVGLVTGLAVLTAYWRNRRWGPAALCFALMPVGFALGTPGILFATSEVVDQIRDILTWYQEQGGGSGFTAERGVPSIWIHWRYLALVGVGLPALCAAVWGLGWTQRTWCSPRRQDAWIGATLLAYMAVYTVLALPGKRLQANLLFPLIVPLALLAAYPLSNAWERRPERRRLIAGGTLIMLLWPAVFATWFTVRIALPDNRQEAQRWIYDHVPPGSTIYVLGPYNVPVDPLDYTVKQTFAREVGPNKVRNSNAHIIVYSDAYPHVVLRDESLSRERDVARENDIQAVLENEWIELARFERMVWPFEKLPPDDVSYWFQIEIVIYCNPTNCPVE